MFRGESADLHGMEIQVAKIRKQWIRETGQSWSNRISDVVRREKKSCLLEIRENKSRFFVITAKPGFYWRYCIFRVNSRIHFLANSNLPWKLTRQSTNVYIYVNVFVNVLNCFFFSHEILQKKKSRRKLHAAKIDGFYSTGTICTYAPLSDDLGEWQGDGN